MHSIENKRCAKGINMIHIKANDKLSPELQEYYDNKVKEFYKERYNLEIYKLIDLLEIGIKMNCKSVGLSSDVADFKKLLLELKTSKEFLETYKRMLDERVMYGK